MITIIMFIIVIIIVVIGFEVPSKGPSRILDRVAISWFYLSFFVQWSGGLGYEGLQGSEVLRAQNIANIRHDCTYEPLQCLTTAWLRV